VARGAPALVLEAADHNGGVVSAEAE
jgi:hypothetical protein